nr:unnamed protein product [Spirometra erinaceieuropaei]
MDLLGFVSRSSALHVTEPRFYKAATTVESNSVVIDGAVDVGFVQAVLLVERADNDEAIVVEPVLVQAACVTEDDQRPRLDCAPQLTPSVLNGGVFVSGGSD